MAEDCLFCSILAGELPAQIVDQDEHTVAFMDINPWTRGHALVVPRNHTRDLLEIDDTDLARTASSAKRLAARMTDRLDCDGVNVINACGEAAWQSVFHFHLHVIPRYADDPLSLPTRPSQAEPDELVAVADELRRA
jgi:histidine triad (HIT) family protein